MLRFGPGAFSGEHSATPTHTQTCSLLSGVLQRNHDSQPRCSFAFYLTADHILLFFFHDADRGKTRQRRKRVCEGSQSSGSQFSKLRSLCATESCFFFLKQVRLHTEI